MNLDAGNPVEPAGACTPSSTPRFPPACPEVPVADIAVALAYYRDVLGFSIDWSEAELGLAGVSRGDARIFLSDAAFRADRGNRAPVVLWINPNNRAEVDALYDEWHAAGARIMSPPEAKPYKLYEFYAQDLDGNVFRVFYDFGSEG